MKIAINCAFFQPKGGGVKEYMHNLLINLAEIDRDNEYVIYVLEDMMDYAKSLLPDKFLYKAIPFKSNSKREVIRRSLFETRFWLNEEKKERWNLFHSPFFHSPKLKTTPVIMTVHDMRFYRFPETYAKLRYQYLKRKVKASVERVEHIITISNFTRAELKEAYGIDDKRITVIHEAINIDRWNKKIPYKPDELPSELDTHPFILSVGHLEPRKNYKRLIEAFQRIKKSEERSKTIKLVIVGKKDHSYSDLLTKIKEDPDILYLDFLDLESLIWLYGHTELFIFPSIYEGFGFPPLEAAVQGTVSAVSNVSSIPEICGNAAIYFNPYDIKEIESAILEGLKKGDKYKSVMKQLSSQLSLFSWKNNALQTLKIYNRFGNENN